MTRVQAKHPHWIGFLLLSERDGVVVHEGHDSRGKFQLKDKRLVIKWDRYPQEEFIELDGVFIFSRVSAKEDKAEKDLVIFRSGAASLHPTWKVQGSRAPWDIYVSPYQEIPTSTPVSGITIGEVIPGPPWPGLSALLNRWTGWRDYRYVMLADDDLLMTESAVTSFFAICASRGAKLAQPGLDAHSYFSHLLTVQNSSFVARKVTFVEVMTPCFQAAVLHELLWTLDLSEIGWGHGLDFLWPKLLAYEDLYIIDEVPIRHTRPVGRDYEPMRDRMILEGQRISERFNCPLLRKVRVGYRPDGQALYDGDASLLYMLVRGYDNIFQRHPQAFLPYVQEQLTPVPTFHQ